MEGDDDEDEPEPIEFVGRDHDSWRTINYVATEIKKLVSMLGRPIAISDGWPMDGIRPVGRALFCVRPYMY